VDTVWINGSLIEANQASINVLDHGLTTGDGAFETLEVINGQPFAIRRHLERLHSSAETLGLQVPYNHKRLASALREVATGLAGRAVVRLTLTGGPGPLGSGRGEGAATVVIAGAAHLAPWPSGEKVHVVDWRRNEHGALTGVKSTSYAENVMALAAAKKVGAGEAIFANTAGQLCEGTGTNVFYAVDGVLHTPPLSAGCLAGITRALVMEVCEVAERDLPIEEFETVEEAFLTSSTRLVQSIALIDDTPLASPGELTSAASEAFNSLRAGDMDP
jgi:branched-chain amino acid aminotransferase